MTLAEALRSGEGTVWFRQLGDGVDAVEVTLRITPLARHRARSAWAEFARQVDDQLAQELTWLLLDLTHAGFLRPFRCRFTEPFEIMGGDLAVLELSVGVDGRVVTWPQVHRTPGTRPPSPPPPGPRKPTSALTPPGVPSGEPPGDADHLVPPSHAARRRPGQHAKPPTAAEAGPPPGADAEGPKPSGAEGPPTEPVTVGGGESAASARRLQCTIGVAGAVPDNVLRRGDNSVGVFLGPQEAHTLVGVIVSDAELELTPEADFVVVHVQLTPLVPEVGTPSAGDLLVPRTGRSATLMLGWRVPDGATEARAQLVVTKAGRVIVLAELSGRVGEPTAARSLLAMGDPTQPRPVASVTPTAVVLDTDGHGWTTATTPSATAVALLPEYEQLAEVLRRLLNKAIALDPSTAAGRKGVAAMLVRLAQAGADLYQSLQPVVSTLGPGPVQVVTSRAPHALPLELLYDRAVPVDAAKLCPAWVAGGCLDVCESPQPQRVVCPAGFWGVRRIIERLYRLVEHGDAEVSMVVPDPNRPRLALDGLVFAASSKVKPEMQQRSALADAPREADWTTWRASLAKQPHGLLVLLPHTAMSAAGPEAEDPPALEISDSMLERPFIGADVVTGGRSDLAPTVILFGCDTAGSEDDLTGFAMRFLNAGAAVVFSSLAKLGPFAAAELAGRLVTALTEPANAGRPVGQVLTEFRRSSLREGLLSAMALTGYGDSEWAV